MKINYHTDVRIWLSLEDYHNAGLSSDDTKRIIQSLRNPFSQNTNLRCEMMGINGNHIVSGDIRGNIEADSIVKIITIALEKELGFK